MRVSDSDQLLFDVSYRLGSDGVRPYGTVPRGPIPDGRGSGDRYTYSLPNTRRRLLLRRPDMGHYGAAASSRKTSIVIELEA
jgi:hypothetical protein